MPVHLTLSLLCTMPFDPYSLCPGGREKKIRFCCPDMVKEIDQIERLLESKQIGSCLTFIENLEKTHPDCACLNAAKLTIFRSESRWADALALAMQFAEKEPENAVAASEYALALAAHGNFRQAVDILIDGFERCKEGTIHSSLLTGMLQVAAQLFLTGHILPVIAVGNRLKAFPMVAEQANAFLLKASTMSEVPLLLRDMLTDSDCPADFPGKAAFDDAIEFLGLMQWKKALKTFETLTVHANHWPNIWRNVAAVRFWLLDTDGGNDALRTFASQPNTHPEDAADAEAIRLFMTEDALGDKTEFFHLEFPVSDADAAKERLLSTPNFAVTDFDRRTYTHYNVPAPQSAFFVLDKQFVKSAAELSLQTVSTQIAACLLFGKETDRSARLEVLELFDDDRPAFDSLLRSALGELYQEPSKTECQGSMSKTLMKIRRRFRIAAEVAPSSETVDTIAKEYFKTELIDFWSGLSLGLLDGQTPKQAAADPKFVPRLQGAIQLIKYWLNDKSGDEVIDLLRTRLGLPGFSAITIPDDADCDPMELLDNQPVWRWHRINVEKLPLEVLLNGLQILSVMKEPQAMSKFSKELLDRPMQETPAQARHIAFEGILDACFQYGNLEEALEWIEKAKNEAKEGRLSDAAWDFHEITVLFGLRRADEAFAKTEHLAEEHGREEGVLQALNNLFVQLGLINPDGTPTVRTRQLREAQKAEAAAGGLWTPDSETGISAGNTSKLWTPD